MDKQSQLRYTPGMLLSCQATSGISPDGSFWLHCVTEHDIQSTSEEESFRMYRKGQIRIGFLMEEVSKAIRRKRIGDKMFQTYAEKNVVPEIGEKCFCIEYKTQRWQRARVVGFENSDSLEVSFISAAV